MDKLPTDEELKSWYKEMLASFDLDKTLRKLMYNDYETYEEYVKYGNAFPTLKITGKTGKVSDLVKENVSVRLYHPIIGDVGWGEVLGAGSGFILYFLTTNEPLVVDWTVLNDNRWELVLPPNVTDNMGM